MELMQDLAQRNLTRFERELATSLFGPRMQLDRVRIVQSPLPLAAAFVPLGDAIIFHGRARAHQDFAKAGASLQGFLAHELTHVWQAQNGIVLALAKLSAIGVQAYRYRPNHGRNFWSFNIEQQAQIVRHAFLAGQGRHAPDAPASLSTDWLAQRLEEARAGRGTRWG